MADNGLVIETLDGDDAALPAVSALLNASLGEGIFPEARVRREAQNPRGVVFTARLDGELVGAAAAKLLLPEDASYYAPFGAEVVDAFTAGVVGSAFAAAVAPAQRGRGVGSRLMARRLAWLAGRGASSVVGLSWVSGAAHTSLPVFLRHGFHRVADVPDFFHESSVRQGWTCDRCGGPCRCTAILFMRALASR